MYNGKWGAEMSGGNSERRLPAQPLPGVQSLQTGLILALFTFHSLQVSSSFGRWFASPVWLLPHVLVIGLAALAGLLVMRRLRAQGVAASLRWLGVRLFGSLFVAVIVAALGIGPLVSTQSLRAYAGEPELWAYFLNLLFWPHFTLPGVFVFNNVPLIVNEIFWALPAIPLAVAGLCAAGSRARRTGAMLLLLLGVAGGAALALDLLGGASAALVRPLGVITGCLVGALGCLWQKRLPWHLAVAGTAAIALVGLAMFGQRAWSSSAVFHALLAVPVGYIVITLAALPLPRPGLGQQYLIGLLLIGFPVQQAAVALGSDQQSFVVNLAVSLPVALLLAVLSWHLIEARLAARAGLAGETGSDLADGDGRRRTERPMSLARARRRLRDKLPEITLWLLFFGAALAIMTMVIFASQPDHGGI